MRERYFKNDHAEMWIEDGIVYIVHAPFVIINEEIAKVNIAKRLEICAGKTYPLYADTTKAKSLTREARKLLSGDDGVRGISAGAFLVKTYIESFLVNTWIGLYPPNRPTKVFTEKKQAIEWLNQFRRIN